MIPRPEYNKENLLKLYNGYGFIIPTGSVFWRIDTGVNKGRYGHQVGIIQHSCHVDITDFIVLHVLREDGDSGTEYHMDMWLSNKTIV